MNKTIRNQLQASGLAIAMAFWVWLMGLVASLNFPILIALWNSSQIKTYFFIVALIVLMYMAGIYLLKLLADKFIALLKEIE